MRQASKSMSFGKKICIWLLYICPLLLCLRECSNHNFKKLSTKIMTNKHICNWKKAFLIIRNLKLRPEIFKHIIFNQKINSLYPYWNQKACVPWVTCNPRTVLQSPLVRLPICPGSLCKEQHQVHMKKREGH